MRLLARLLPVVIVATLITFPQAPAAADHASKVVLRLSAHKNSESATVRVRLVRDGWGVKFRALSAESDANERICYYFEVKLNVAKGHDPDRKIGPRCDDHGDGGVEPPPFGGGGGIRAAAGKGFFGVYTLNAKEGTRLQDVEVKLCLKKGIDPCDKDVIVLPEHTAHASASELRALDRLMALPLSEFLARAKRGGGGYDWVHDGCSAPDKPGVRTWKKRFISACIRHDFGYRNYGAGAAGNFVWADPTDARRAEIDDIFRQDLAKICARNDWRLCGTAAKAFVQVVRKCGATGFYREKYNACPEG